MSKTLAQLVTSLELTLDESVGACEITGLSLDSRHVSRGDLFFAYTGTQTDGRQYIDEAISRGAAAILCEADKPELTVHDQNAIPVIDCHDLMSHVGFIAAELYDHPSRQLSLLGVTGTNGKTSCTHLLAQAYEHLQKRCGILGTIGCGFLPNLDDSELTTPDPISVQRILSELKQQHADAIAMEVSSHALSQGRVNGCDFKTALFTNLSRDHLDYHHSMENYIAAKHRLFEMPLQNAVLNIDDPVGLQWANTLHEDNKHVYGYSLYDTLKTNFPLVFVKQIQLHEKGMTVNLHTPWGDGVLRTALLGRFNVSNLLAVLIVLCLEGFPLQDVLQALALSQTIAGRMEPFVSDHYATVIVDYAHTPDALKQALMALREHCQGKLWCVFGCGGDRDKGKRALMAKAVEDHADYLIMTDDNPRYEDPGQIIQDMLHGLTHQKDNVHVIHARDQAIYYALEKADQNDMILLAGKGHEPYQLIWGEKKAFSDRHCVNQFINQAMKTQ